jgi:hypothetical protein
MSEYSGDQDFNYQRWLRVNMFMQELHRQHYAYRLAEELDRLDEIDMIVDEMDSYPEVEEILDGLWKN